MRTLLALLLAAWCSHCFADEGAERLAAAKRLVELTGVAESAALSAADCLPKEAELAAQAKSVYEKHPEKFEGITPQSAYWPDFERIYRWYAAETCLYLIPDAIANAYARALAAKVSLPELQAAIQFYSSPEGQRFAKGAVEASQQYCADLKQAQTAMLAHARSDYHTGLHKLIERYKANPK